MQRSTAKLKLIVNHRAGPSDSSGAMPSARAASLRPQPASPFSRSGIAIAGPSRSFLSLTRNPDLEAPARFEPTVKGVDDVVI